MSAIGCEKVIPRRDVKLLDLHTAILEARSWQSFLKKTATILTKNIWRIL